MSRRVDLYTDASVKHGVGAWAFVIIAPGLDPIEDSGRFRRGVTCSATAEAQAIANALHRLIRAGHAEGEVTIRVLTDNRGVANILAGKQQVRPRNRTLGAAIAAIGELAAGRSITLKASWIKGHRPDTADCHAPHNNRCDQLCKAARQGPPPPTKARKAYLRARALMGGTL